MKFGKNLIKTSQMYEDNGLPACLKSAPKNAVTFYKMLIIFSDESLKTIRKVLFYNSRKDKFVGEF